MTEAPPDDVADENREIVEAFYRYLDRYSSGSTAAHRKRHVRPFLDYCQENSVSILAPKRYELRRHLRALADDHADKYVIARKDAISQLFNFADDERELLADEYEIDVPEDLRENPVHGVIGDLDVTDEPRKAKAARKDIVALNREEAEELAKRGCMPDPVTRNLLVVKLLIQTGVRAGELAGIRLQDLDRAPDRRIRIRGEKTKDNRTVYYRANLDPMFNQWLDGGLRAAYPTADSEYLFISHKSKRFTQKGINDIVKKAAESAGIQRTLYEDANGREMNFVTAHTLRHTFARFWVEDGGDIARLAKLMGHTTKDGTPNLDTTRKYLRAFGEESLREAVEAHAPSI